ncbi:hypothetical protein BDZ89DRAFT_1055939 [Hymenopellis radicata]|nr:hypothetical protein BDZ89DRAFT_1055939 [Hymenopellis radicata]
MLHSEVLAAPYEDANSTWEFRATSVPCSRSRLSPAQKIALKYREGSPAQQIVMKYRQREFSIVITDVTSSRNSTSSSDMAADAPAKEQQFNEDLEDGSSILENASYILPDADDDKETAFIESDAPMLRHSVSCAQLFGNAMEEAGASPEDALMCPRIDCKDTVRNVRALQAHLTIHDIATRVEELYLVCHHCEARFATRQALGMHSCVGNTMSPPSSPIVESFKQVLSLVTAFTL